ncbi:phosphatase and actin regulator 2 [Trichonephila clavipes]|nr:phosphatase and actin regulator 2 [Trichonephila clavipes]
MKTSSVEFISRSPTPSPMESKHRRFVLLRKIFQHWQWKRRKKRNRFEQTSRTLERKISMRSTKDQLVKKDVLMPVKHNVFSSGLDEKGKKGRTAADSVQSGWPIVAAKAKQSSRAGAANENRNCKNFKTLEKKQKRRERERTATAGSDVVQSGRPIFDDFFQHLWPYIGNNTANVVFQMVKRLWLIRIDQ